MSKSSSRTVDNIRGELSTLEDLIADLEDENVNLRCELGTLESELADARAEIDSLNAETEGP